MSRVGKKIIPQVKGVDIKVADGHVTVKGPKRTVELKVQDPAQFKMIKKGDQIEATFTEAVAVAVTPAKK